MQNFSDPSVPLCPLPLLTLLGLSLSLMHTVAFMLDNLRHFLTLLKLTGPLADKMGK